MRRNLIKRGHKIGLEIGRDRIAGAVIEQQGKSCKLISAFYREVSDPEQQICAKEITRCIEDNQLIGKEVGLVLDDPSLYLRHLAVPRSLMEESENQLKWYMEQFLPYPVSKAAYSHHNCGVSFGINDLIIVGVVFSEAINQVIAVLDQSGTRLSKIDTVPFAMQRLFHANYDAEPDNCTGIFDFAANHGYGMVLKGKKIMIARRFVLVRSGGKGVPEAIEDTLRSFEMQFPQDVVSRVCITARSQIEHAVQELVKAISKVEVEQIDPGRRIDTGAIDQELLPQTIAAIGAALDHERAD